MDLIYANSSLVDLGIIQNCSIDFEASVNSSECTFELETDLSSNPLEKGYYLHTDNTELGGRVDSIEINTAKKTVKANGRTWRGILASKIVEPPANEAYRVVSGNVNDIIRDLLDEYELDDLFEVTGVTDIIITNYSFSRYVDLYTGLTKMLEKKSAKLKIFWDRDKVEIRAVPVSMFTSGNSITSDMFDFKIKTSTSINHVIGLGKGELTERDVVHRYLDADGNVSTTQYYTGLLEYTEVYENTNAESLAELIKGAEEKLLDSNTADELEITAHNLEADIGDVFEAEDMETGIKVTRKVTNKIITIANQVTKTQYKVG